MRTTYKYAIPFPKDDEKGVVVQMPHNAKVLSVGEQNGDVFAWALVETHENPEPRRFWIHGTGHPVSNHANFLGTVHMRGGALVFHIFG